MPVVIPTITPFVICDLVPDVIATIENRTQAFMRAQVWLRDVIIEISSNPDYRDEFDQLEIWSNPFNLVQGVQEYPDSNYVPEGQVNLANLDFMIWLDPPGNTVRKKLEQMDFQESDRFQPLNSLPTQWYRFNANVGFNPVPDLPYQVQARLQQFHPINDADLCQTVILLPREWNHLLVLAAAERGYIEYSEYDKAARIHTLLYGDPNKPMELGLFKKACRRRERERWRSTQPLRPSYKPMMYGA